MRLAGHRSRSFAVKTSRHIADSPASVCHAMPGYGITDPPMAAVTASGYLMGRRASNRGYARFFPTQTLGPASLSIRHGRLHAVSSGAAQHGKSKVWSYDGLSVDGLLITGLVPQIWNDALMRPNTTGQSWRTERVRPATETESRGPLHPPGWEWTVAL